MSDARTHQLVQSRPQKCFGKNRTELCQNRVFHDKQSRLAIGMNHAMPLNLKNVNVGVYW